MIRKQTLIIVGAILLLIVGVLEESSLYIMIGACTIIQESIIGLTKD